MTVTANLVNADAAIVELYTKDEEGNLSSSAEAVATTTVEEGVVTAKFDFVIDDVKAGTYTVVVTAGDVTEELEVEIDFTEVDAIVEAVTTAKTEIALEEALVAGGFDFDEALITKYAEAITGSEATIADINKVIEDTNLNAANETLVAELKELAGGTQKALLERLQEEFENVVVANINEYQTYLKSVDPEVVKPSDIVKKFDVINAEVDFAAKDTALTTAVAKIAVAATAKQEDVDAAKAALEAATASLAALKEVDSSTSKIITETTAQAKIDAAQVELDKAKDAATALADAIKVAKEAQRAHLLAGGKKTDTVYTDVDTAIAAEGATAATVKVASDALVAATKVLTDVKAAIPAAEKALADFKAAGGDVTSSGTDYKKVEESLAILKDAKQSSSHAAEVTKLNAAASEAGSIAKLNAATKALVEAAELQAETVKAAEKALADFKAAGGVTEGSSANADYTAVAASLAILKDASKSVQHAGEVTKLNEADTEDGSIAKLNKATKELVNVKAINDAITANDAAALDNVIFDLAVTEFTELSEAERLEVAQLVITDAKAGTEIKVYEKTADLATALNTPSTGIVAKYKEAITSFNTAANASSGTTTAKRTALITAIKATAGEEVLAGLNASQQATLADKIMSAVDSENQKVVYAAKTNAEIKAIVEANK